MIGDVFLRGKKAVPGFLHIVKHERYTVHFREFAPVLLSLPVRGDLGGALLNQTQGNQA
jgi:hypothetical protein